MELVCVVCGEPVDLDELHDVGMPFAQAYRLFVRQGCSAFDWDCVLRDDVPQEIAMIYHLMGDDVDGAAAMLEDFMTFGGGE